MPRNAPLGLDGFLTRAHAAHGERYDYARVRFVNMTTKVEIICRVHGSFWQTPDSHGTRGCGCPRCYLESGKPAQAGRASAAKRWREHAKREKPATIGLPFGGDPKGAGRKGGLVHRKISQERTP